MYKIISSSCILVFVLHVHPLLLVLPGLVDLLPLLRQLALYLGHRLLHLLVQDLPALLLLLGALIVLLQVLVADGPLVELERAVGQHVNGLDLVAGVVVQPLEEIPGFRELLHLDQVLAHCCDRLCLVILPLVDDPLVEDQQFVLGRLEVILPHQVVGLLDPHIDAARVGLLSQLHGLDALALGLLFLEQVGEAHLGDAGVGLGDVPLDLRLWRGGFERVFDALLSSCDALLEGLDGVYSCIDISELHVALVAASGHFLDGPLQDLLGLLLVLVELQEVGVAHDQHFVGVVLGVGEGIEVLSLLVLQRLIFLLSHLEQRLKWEFLERFDRHQQPINFIICH